MRGIGEADEIAALNAGSAGPVIRTSIRVGEMANYSDNVWHALKVARGIDVVAMRKNKRVSVLRNVSLAGLIGANREFRDIASRLGPQHHEIDLVRIGGDERLNGGYDGFNW